MKKYKTFFPIVGPNTLFKKYFDIAALVASGCAIGLAIAAILATVFSGTSTGIYLDLGITISAAALGILAFLILRGKLALICLTTLATFATIAGIGSFQTNKILETGEALANGRPWCLTSTSRSLQTGQVSDIGQLGFFSLPKGNSYPHLGLVIGVRNQTYLAAHWSIKQQKFEPSEYVDRYTPTCLPVKDFASALAKGEIESNSFALGPVHYSIPDKYQPRAFMDRLRIRMPKPATSGDATSARIDHVNVYYSPSEPHIPVDAIGLQDKSKLTQIDLTQYTYRNELVLTDSDKTAGKQAILHCSYRSCRAEVFDGSLKYVFGLSYEHLDEWSEATRHVSQLFNSSQQ
ncbi:hypothetical protein [Flexibacterium corallicola]|uniref:hypothetical protein n=1 Tax=Flexibacterium corallicola TaxID=3037259 RepID=UPI00286EDB62|nr:hypothetical protein [Pseudovibrio sp. M1P-2-3]